MPFDPTDRRQSWLALSMLDGLGPAARRQLLDEFADPTEILQADLLTLGRLGFSTRIQNAVHQYQRGDNPADKIGRAHV